MNERYGIRAKKIRLQALQQRFGELEEESNRVSNQRGSTVDARDVLKLDRQLKDTGDKLSEIGLEIDTLQKEIQEFEQKELNVNLPHALQTLVDVLEAISFEIVATTYRLCLFQGHSRWVPNNLEALVCQLADIPGEPDEPEPLLRFLRLLLQQTALTDPHRKSLRAWAKKQGMTDLDEQPELPERSEVCLMIKVQPRAFNDPSLGYILDASIAQDSDPWNCDIAPLTTILPITVSPDPKHAPGYSQDDLPRVLDSLIAACGEHRIPLTELVIQWFLPNELMSLPVEHWQFQSGKYRKEHSGRRCKAVIVRSSDRHFLPHYQAASGDWQKYWGRLLNCHESKCSEALVRLDPIRGRTNINWKNDRIVGCKFVEHPDPQQQEMLWDELLGQGIPIALWRRHAGAQRRKSSLSTCTIANLSESLATHRQEALSHDSEADRLRAASLCLLLDNPYRPFPTLDYESA